MYEDTPQPHYPGTVHRREWVPPEATLRRFRLCCAGCEGYQVRFRATFDESSGELKLGFFCPGCHRQEVVGKVEIAQ